MKTQHKIALIGIAGVMVAGYLLTHIYIHHTNRKELLEVARELAYTWKKQLELDFAQTEKLENLIIEYTLKKNEIINSAMAENEIIIKLKAIQKTEYEKLQKFLTKKQFENYMLLNKKIYSKA